MTFNNLTFRVKDLQKQLDFYQLLGFKLLDNNTPHVHTLQLEGGCFTLELIHQPEAPLGQRNSLGLYHFALLLPHRQALAQVFRLLIDHKYPFFEGASNHGVSESVYLHDPEGNGIELYRDRPKKQWLTADGKIVFARSNLDLPTLYMEAEQSAPLHSNTTIGHLHFYVSELDGAEAFFRQYGLNMHEELMGQVRLMAWGDYHHHISINIWNKEARIAGSTGLVGYTLKHSATHHEGPVSRSIDPNGFFVDIAQLA